MELCLLITGPDHINKVIERASSLVKNANLSPYEVYILLVAIQLHDLGNYYGRVGHENKIPEILAKKSGLFGTDQVETKIIQSIAMVHGGTVVNSGDKDTIIQLQDTLRHQASDFPVRPRVLAGILRFSDELAEDASRANASMLKDGSLPKQCEIYHAYAHSLKNVEILNDEREIIFHFTTQITDLCKKYGKYEDSVYLIDEIFDRIYKTHIERIYCTRFTRPEVDFDKISVVIEIYRNMEDPNEFSPAEKPIKFSVADRGYPGDSPEKIYGICKELKEWEGNGQLTGSFLAKKYSRSSPLLKKIIGVFRA